MSMARHERPHAGATDKWLTPPWILAALGPFDLDPCSSEPRPWPTARRHFTEKTNGLLQPWFGRVFLNPPYGPETGTWMGRLAAHGNGVALVFARTDTDWFEKTVWRYASGILFIGGRVRFHDASGKPGTFTGGAPSVLVAYGHANAQTLAQVCGKAIPGKFISLRSEPT